MHYQLRAVALDDGGSALGAEDVGDVGAQLEGREGGKERGAGVLPAAPDDSHLARRALVHFRCMQAGRGPGMFRTQAG